MKSSDLESSGSTSFFHGSSAEVSGLASRLCAMPCGRSFAVRCPWVIRITPIFMAMGGLMGCEGDRFEQVHPELRVSPDLIDFGAVELSQQKTETVLLENVATVSLKVLEVRVEDDCNGCFLAVNPPTELASFEEYDLGIRFRAIRLPIATGTVTIVSDDPGAPEQRVFLRGRGRDGSAPDVEVIPEEVDFGFLPAGGISLGSFVIRSTGTSTLLVDRMAIDPPNAPFVITTSTPTPAMPGELAPGRQASVSLRAQLPETISGTASARVLIETNVLAEKNVPGRPGVVAVRLTGVANRPPVAVVPDRLTIEPWSRATVDGSASYDPDGPSESLIYRWRLLIQPGGSRTTLDRQRDPVTSFWADLTGSYELELTVVDVLGLESAPAVVPVEALARNAIRIELTWDHPDSDLDLHLIREGGSFCDCSTDVHYRDCGRTPNWFADAPGANPRLDVDDRSGFGPENINIDGDGTDRFVPEGRYTVAVHYYSSHSETSSWETAVSRATVRVFVFGLLAGEFEQDLVNDGDLWMVGRIDWPSQTLTEDGMLFSGLACGIF